jgi:hypothetical protein
VGVPIFINCRDRVTPLRRLVAWLERAGCDELYLLDNDSTWEPLLEYYEATPHTVLRLGENYGKNALWQAPGVFALTRGRRFVYSDPDVVPIEECPTDALERFDELLDRWSLGKAGFGLRFKDIPDHYPHRDEVLIEERAYWQWPLERGAYLATIDTIFALYREEGTPRPQAGIRTGFPYVARHDSWYVDFDDLSAEERHYQSRHSVVEGGPDALPTSWAMPALTDVHVRKVRALSANQRKVVRRWTTALRWRLYGRRRLRLRAARGGAPWRWRRSQSARDSTA